VLDVVVRKGQVTRGQAWVVFGSVESSTKAITTLQRYPFFEKELVLNFAKENADVVAKLEGTYVKRAKKVREEPVPKKMRVAEEEAVAPAPAPGGFSCFISLCSGSLEDPTRETPLRRQGGGPKIRDIHKTKKIVLGLSRRFSFMCDTNKLKLC
jgi:hypothetical protein